jgi:TIR domain-containing protein
MSEGPNSSRRLRIFLCHSSGDKKVVRDLYRQLYKAGFGPWLDEEDLLPGQDWQAEIPKAVRRSDIVLVCLSRSSISKEGYVHKEIKYALDIADEKPEGTIYIVPVKLEVCEVPDRLSQWQWVELYKEDGYKNLVKALEYRAANLNINVLSLSPNASITSLPFTIATAEAKLTKEEKDKATQHTLSPLVYATVSAISLLIAIALLLFINKAQELVQAGIDKKVFYVLLVPLNLSFLVFVLGAMRLYAMHQNTNAPGTVALSGPIVGAIIFILVSILLVPSSDTFNITVRVFRPTGDKLSSGKVTLYIGQGQWQSYIEGNGEANFKEVPQKFNNKKAKIIAEGEGYNVMAPEQVLSNVINLTIPAITPSPNSTSPSTDSLIPSPQKSNITKQSNINQYNAHHGNKPKGGRQRNDKPIVLDQTNSNN